MFELQIKSLANLYWGEMEHLLIYKNPKCTLLSGYNKKEIEAIYDELEIIDTKLSRIEKHMLFEDVNSKIDELRDVLKRYLYLRFKKNLSEYFSDPYINNNYIYESIAFCLFDNYQEKIEFNAHVPASYTKGKPHVGSLENPSEIHLETQNTVLGKLLSFLLNKQKCEFDFNELTRNCVDDTISMDKYTKQAHSMIKGLLDDLNSGWNVYYTLLALLKYVVSEEYNPETPINSQVIITYYNEVHKEVLEAVSNYNIYNQIVTEGKSWGADVENGILIFVTILLSPIYCRRKLVCISQSAIKVISSDAVKIFDYICNIDKASVLNKIELIDVMVKISFEQNLDANISENVVQFLTYLRENDEEYTTGFSSRDVELFKAGKKSISKKEFFAIIADRVGDVDEN